MQSRSRSREKAMTSRRDITSASVRAMSQSSKEADSEINDAFTPMARSRSRSSSFSRSGSGSRETRLPLKDVELMESQTLLSQDNVNVGRFKRTSVSLKNLQEVLGCHNCKMGLLKKESQELFSLGICEHRFCKSCIEGNQQTSCPVCLLPYRVTNVHVDKQLSNIAALCTSLANILEGNTEEPETEVCFPISTNDTAKVSDANKPQHNTPTRSKAAIEEKKSCVADDDVKTTPVGKNRSNRLTPVGPSGPTFQTPRSKPRGRRRTSVDKHETETVPAQKNQATPKVKKENLQTKDESLPKTGASTPVLHDETSTPGGSGKKRPNKQQGEADSQKKQKNAKLSEKIAASSPSSKNQALLEKRNAKGETRLQVAAVKADLVKVQELLTQGANPNVKDNAGWTPLHEAVIHGNTRIAELLLDHGASVNAPGLENDTPLHDAVSNYSLDCVHLLVKKGANVMARNTHGKTALDLAKTEDMREALLAAGGVSTVPQEESFMGENTCSSVKLGFVASALTKEENAQVQKCAKLLDARLINGQSAEVTHSITGVNAEGLSPRTAKYLTAVLSGAWIVTSQWIDECLNKSMRVTEDSYEAQGCTTTGKCDAPQRARMNRLKQLPGLFDGCQFYFHGKFQFPTLSKEELTNMAKLGGGVILTREPRLYNLDDYPYTIPYHATPNSSLSDCAIFVIYDDRCPNPPHVKAQRMSCLPASWFLDSIASFTLLEKTEYLKY